jgi:16S rRNA (adenine1518-N6/adenine1519-N6)-dimethyltransferase
MLKPRKRFGQHFLNDSSIIHQIIAEIDPAPEDHLIEIGPGQGALTLSLFKLYPDIHLTAIEIDRDLSAWLKQKITHLHLYQADVLKFDFSQFPQSELRIIGNLPYNISTPLLFHLMDYKDKIKDMHFMLQKEVVERLSASPDSKAYGRLSIMIQYDFTVIPLFSVPPEAFTPPPQVQSAMVKLIPKTPEIKIKDPSLFEVIVREAFQHRRKTLKNALKKYIGKENMILFNINPDARPEVLSVNDYVKLCNQITDREC